MGPKLRNIKVQCGCDSVLWINVVVAAARIKAYHDDLRQKFPNIENILELDSLREIAQEHLINSVTPKIIFDLLCRYRHFSATDPKDKLYAFCNMFCRLPSERVATRYDADLKDIYIKFAVDRLLAESNLEILRHCGPSAHSLPSWVPDWSVPLGVQPLPLRKLQRYFQVPWWANPIRRGSHRYMANHNIVHGSNVQYHLGPYTRDPFEAERQRQLELKQLEIAAKGYGIVQDLQEIPPDFTFHKSPCTFQDQIQELLKQGNLIFSVQDERCLPPESEFFGTDQPDAVKQGEIITERRIKGWILRELTELGANAQYQTAQGTRADIRINQHESTLQVKGILWETIDICHEGFVEDLDLDWKNATRFMVGVGSCKALALSHKSAAERYPTLLERLTVFWSTLFAGQVAESDSTDEQESLQRLRYTEWLPEIPPDWVAGTPPLTATTTGLVDIAESGKAIECCMNNFQADGGGGEPLKSSFSMISEKIFNPEQWPDAERESQG
ncbi:uncharacterized protein A1O5_04880 [Cladophialophora psammophila CBS 110553]|uniref:Heterokaryon incompatibility domain-containing protein n=1 Tax=Cladophialophora psammophila CBS 110553 TaxID=1182543 RepID=W9X654_9EURO|nr:uncharacterized protein A1O5_04880 [Cladophialophora psammophila CBS 110553]EXJ72376.1 hypothetical protein A1O5_04880 [Cladophialophora psammophila CBS 110553]